ncbi:MAG: 50S ribosomal protein L3 [Planctomycetota bacterium]
MVEALLGKKVGMTSVYTRDGKLVPVTVIELGPCTVTQVKTAETDGYTALQIGFEDRRPKNVTKPLRGHYEKAGTPPKRFLREVGWDGEGDIKPGTVLTAEIFAGEKSVDVIGTTKGRGFQGVVKRHGFAGGPKTHGQSDRHRAPGSIGQSAYPSRVFKGTRMPGRMGGERQTVRNLTVVRVDPERNAILVRGAIPGHRSGYVIVRRTVEG